MDMMIVSKEKLHKLIDALPEKELSAAERFLRYLNDIGSDPVLKALSQAAEEDELILPEEETMVQEARASYRQGDVLSDQELDQELGL
jgi:hypothetical protein